MKTYQYKRFWRKRSRMPFFSKDEKGRETLEVLYEDRDDSWIETRTKDVQDANERSRGNPREHAKSFGLAETKVNFKLQNMLLSISRKVGLFHNRPISSR
jgi:hypothetical protein